MPGLPEFDVMARWKKGTREERESVVRPLVERLRKDAAGLGLGDLPAVTPVPQPYASETNERTNPLDGNPFQAVRKRRTSSQWTETLLRQIELRNPQVNAFSKVHAEEARESAKRADTAQGMGRPWSALHGVPVGVKDNIAVQGWPWTGSSAVLGEQVAAEDATVISRLRYGGAVLVGQTIMHELAFGMTSINPHLGAVRNPWDPERICGGSSGGSAAAVAAGMVPVALGTDTGGSVRCPATLCGVVGFKPSFGAVSRAGVLPLGGTLDTVGPIARSAAQCLAVHRLIAGVDAKDPATALAHRGRLRDAATSLEGIRVGLPKPYFENAMEEEVRRLVEAAVERLRHCGARVEPVEFPDLAAINNAALVALLAEAGAFFTQQLASGIAMGEDVRGRMEQGLLVTAVDYLNTQRLRARWMAEVQALFTECDVLLTPASPVVAPRIEDPYTMLGGERVDARTAVSRYLRSFNFLGLPGLALPCGLTSAGLPAGIQLVGPGMSDEWLLELGILVE